MLRMVKIELFSQGKRTDTHGVVDPELLSMDRVSMQLSGLLQD